MFDINEQLTYLVYVMQKRMRRRMARALEKYDVEQIVEVINGFAGYYAYVFRNHCVLESAIYGNATYIIPKKNWEVYSQMTKKELFDDKIVIEKLIHNKKWSMNIKKVIKKYENQ